MKKWLALVLTMVMVIGLFGSVISAEEGVLDVQDFTVEYLAAPAVAGLLLEQAGLDNRYGSGKDGGNYISDVARKMEPGTDFNGISIDQELQYKCAIAHYLKSIGATTVQCPCEGILDPVASGATFRDNANRTGTMLLTILDKCGDGIEGLGLADITVDIQWVGLTDLYTLGAGGYWDIDLVDNGNGLYEITFYRQGSVPYIRNWDVIIFGEVIEDDLYVVVSNPATIITLEITSVNNNTGFTHSFIITYYLGTDTGTGIGVGEVVSDIEYNGTQISFKSVYPNNYTWYPAFILEENGTLTYVELGGDNVTTATGTWSIQ